MNMTLVRIHYVEPTITGHKSDFKFHEIPDMCHMLREVEGESSTSDYKRQVRQPVDSRLMDLITEWARKHAKT